MTDRAGRSVTERVGRNGRTVNKVAVELGGDWYTANDTVVAYGTPLVDDPDRITAVDALGLDEVVFARVARWRTRRDPRRSAMSVSVSVSASSSM